MIISSGVLYKFFVTVLFVVKIHTGHCIKEIENSKFLHSKNGAKYHRNGKIFFNQLFNIANLFGTVGAGFTEYLDNDLDYDDYRGKNCSCECGVSNQENRIVGGRPTGVNRYPWIARIVYDGNYHCGASLLTEDFVVTAAHCVRRLKKSKIKIILGDHDASTNADVPAMMRAVSAVIKHRSFDPDTYNHDIALLKLRKPVQFTKQIRPICLPKTVDPAGRTGTVIGWGRTAEGGMLPNIVQEVDVPILTLSQCRAMKYRASRITTYMLCAGKGVQDSCQGDSGGPLLVHTGDKYEIVGMLCYLGIVSWGVGCGRPGYPGVYTRVAKYVNWLKYNTEDSCFCS